MNKIHLGVPALALIVGGEAFSQQYLSVSVRDSKSPTPIANAVVEELGSGQTLVTDATGDGEFASQFLNGGTVQFMVTASGFPVRYFERIIPEAPLDPDFATHHILELTQENELVSPILGISGGSKSASLATGYLLDDSTISPTPIEYSQSISASVPAGALASNYRVGFSAIPGAGQAENLLNILQTGAGKSVVAQFEWQWLDVTGNPAIPPILSQPIRIEMSAPSLYFAEELPGTWQVSLYKFDESSFSWVQAADGTSGMQSDGTLWADMLEPGYYSFMGYEMSVGLAVHCEKKWVEEEWIGPAEDDSDVTCPNSNNQGGAQTHVSVTYGGTEGTRVAGSVSGSLSTKLKLLGLKSEASVAIGAEREDTWGTYKDKTYGWSDNAYAGEGQGKIYLHPKGWLLTQYLYCYDCETGEPNGDPIQLEQTDPIKTGYTVRKDLSPCP